MTFHGENNIGYLICVNDQRETIFLIDEIIILLKLNLFCNQF
jgi:hypothetical protein